MEHFGRILWSDFFKCRILVVEYQSDKVWWFVPEDRWFGRRIIKAKTKLSEMKEYDEGQV